MSTPCSAHARIMPTEYFYLQSYDPVDITDHWDIIALLFAKPKYLVPSSTILSLSYDWPEERCSTFMSTTNPTGLSYHHCVDNLFWYSSISTVTRVMGIMYSLLRNLYYHSFQRGSTTSTSTSTIGTSTRSSTELQVSCRTLTTYHQIILMRFDSMAIIFIVRSL